MRGAAGTGGRAASPSALTCSTYFGGSRFFLETVIRSYVNIHSPDLFQFFVLLASPFRRRASSSTSKGERLLKNRILKHVATVSIRSSVRLAIKFGCSRDFRRVNRSSRFLWIESFLKSLVSGNLTLTLVKFFELKRIITQSLSSHLRHTPGARDAFPNRTSQLQA